MWITIHLNLSAAVVGSVLLFALGYVTGWIRTRITRRKRRS
jgi:putative effector of murein hydrolase LrgA (UPF0299 family)